MTGQAWTAQPAKAPAALANAFTAKLSGATAVSLDTGRMHLKPRTRMEGAITTEKTLRLDLKGAWTRLPLATLDGSPVTVTRAGPDAIEVEIPAVGTHQLVLSPA